MNLLNKLMRVIDLGYLLHGSQNYFTVVEPQQAHDDNKRETGCQYGIYATKDIRIAVLVALFHPTNPKDWQSGYSGVEGGAIRVFGYNVTFEPGYVYVLPHDTFEWVGTEEKNRELISRVPVKPIEIIEVTPVLLSEFNLIIEIETPR